MTAMPPLRDILNNTPATAVDVDYNFGVIEGHVGSELVNRDGSVAMTGPLSLPGAPTAPQQAATKAYVDSQVIPIGTIWEYAGTAAPAGWAFCDGSSKSTTDPIYAALFAVIGYTCGGAGTSFLLPDRKGRVGVGRSAGDALFGTLGAKGGSRDLIVVSHNHTGSVNLSSGGNNVDHVHSLAGHQHYVEHQHDLQNHVHGSGVRSGYDISGADRGGGTTNAIYTSNPPGNGQPLGFIVRPTAVQTGVVPGPGENNTGGPSPNNTGYMTARSYSDGPNTPNSGGASVGHVHNVSGGITVDAQGASGANGNLAPYEVVNFIVRIG